MSNDTNTTHTSDPNTPKDTTVAEQMEQSIFSLVVSLWELKMKKHGKEIANQQMLELFGSMATAFSPQETAT